MNGLTRKAVLVQGALMAFLSPKLAADAKVDLAPALDGVTAENFAERKKTIADGVTTATEGKLAQDAKLDGIDGLLTALEPIAAPEPTPKVVEKQVGVTQAAIDEAIDKAKKDAADTVRKEQRAIRDAETLCEPFVGKLSVACDSADDVFRATFKVLGQDVKDIHPSAYPALLKLQRRPSAGREEDRIEHAVDGDSAAKFSERFGTARFS